MFLRCILAVVLIAVVSADDDSSPWVWALREDEAEEGEEEEDDDDEDGGIFDPYDPSADDGSDGEHCLTHTGKVGKCVVYYQCDPDSLKADGSKKSLSWISQCSSYLDVCCDYANFIPLNSLPSPDQAVLFPLTP